MILMGSIVLVMLNLAIYLQEGAPATTSPNLLPPGLRVLTNDEILLSYWKISVSDRIGSYGFLGGRILNMAPMLFYC